MLCVSVSNSRILQQTHNTSSQINQATFESLSKKEDKCTAKPCYTTKKSSNVHGVMEPERIARIK